jgi:hypothetical protein
MKRAKRGDTSYTEICKERKRGEVDSRDREIDDSGGEWIVQMGRKERRWVRERSDNEERRLPVNEGWRVRLPKTRNRPDTLLVKVWEREKWLQTYKELMVGRETLKLKAGVTGIALKIKDVTGDKVLVSSLQSRNSAEIRNIDPLESSGDLELNRQLPSGIMIRKGMRLFG